MCAVRGGAAAWAGALLTRAFAALAGEGQRRVELGVDAEGETRPLHLYESVGMRVAHAYELFEKRLGLVPAPLIAHA